MQDTTFLALASLPHGNQNQFWASILAHLGKIFDKFWFAELVQTIFALIGQAKFFTKKCEKSEWHK